MVPTETYAGDIVTLRRGWGSPGSVRRGRCERDRPVRRGRASRRLYEGAVMAREQAHDGHSLRAPDPGPQAG